MDDLNITIHYNCCGGGSGDQNGENDENEIENFSQFYQSEGCLGWRRRRRRDDNGFLKRLTTATKTNGGFLLCQVYRTADYAADSADAEGQNRPCGGIRFARSGREKGLLPPYSPQKQ